MNDTDLCKLINLYGKNKSVNSEVEMNYVNSVNKEIILELYWDHEKDIISLKIKEVFEEAINIIPTKRNILSVMQVFTIQWVIYNRQLLNSKNM